MPNKSQQNKQTLASQVYQTLRDEIASGKLVPGERLVRRNLAKRLGVSPIPVIEALLRLTKDGLVESEPMSGSRVMTLSIETVMNDRVLREAIECQAARLCAECANPDQIELLHAKAELLDEVLEELTDNGDNAENLRRMRDMHLDFHMQIAKTSGYPSLERELEHVWFRRLMLLGTLNMRQHAVPKDWHITLVKAIESGDPDIAESHMRKHTSYKIQNYREILKKTILLWETEMKSESGNKKES